MSNELAVIEHRTAVPARMTVRDQLALAHEMAGAGLLPEAYRRNPANLLYALQYAEALQVHPMTAITGIHVIQGKPTASAQLIGGLVRRAGHKLRVKFDAATKTATAEIVRADDPDYTFTAVWTMERAKTAKLNTTTWQSYPEAMLKARAITEVARDACPEALFGVIYTPEELGATVDADGTIIDVQSSEVQPDGATDEQLDEILELHSALGGTDEQLAGFAQRFGGVSSVYALTEEQAGKLIEFQRATKARIDEAAAAEASGLVPAKVAKAEVVKAYTDNDFAPAEAKTYAADVWQRAGLDGVKALTPEQHEHLFDLVAEDLIGSATESAANPFDVEDGAA